MTLANDIAANLAAVKGRIAEAARTAGRAPEAVELVAISKTKPAEAIAAAIAAGQRVFGENRVQEAEEKWPAIKAVYPGVSLHLVGPLQRNKLRRAVALFDVIQSVDRERLAAALAEEMVASGRRLGCFIQVNTGEEPQRPVSCRQGRRFVAACASASGLDVQGLMSPAVVEELRCTSHCWPKWPTLGMARSAWE